jgi:phage tail sheath gpL-like
MSILVADPSSPTPGIFLRVNLKPSGADASGDLKILLIAPKNTTGGSITADAAPVEIAGVTEAVAQWGIGSLGALMARKAREVNPTVRLFASAPAASAGSAAAGSFTFASSPTSNMTFRLWVSGRYKDVAWLVGEAVNDARTRALSRLAELVGKVHAGFTAAVTDGVITVTAPATGPTGNDVTISVEVLEGAGGTCTASGANLSGGTTEVDIEDALAAAADYEFDYIVPALSNAAAAATTGNLATLETHLLAYDDGPNAFLQQGVVGCTGARTAVAAAAQARNEQVLEIVNAQNARSLPCEVGVAEAADVAMLRALYTSYNRIGRELPIVLPLDPQGENPTQAQSDACLRAGVSYLRYTIDGRAVIGRAVTTYTIDSEGATLKPTDRNEVDAMFDAGKDLRRIIQTEYPNSFVMRDADVADGEEVPPRTVQEADIKGTIVARVLGYWCRGNRGVFSRAYFQGKVDDGTMVVRVNDDDETQVDIFVPMKPSKIWAKTGMLVEKGS